MKVSELSGTMLDYWVAKAEELNVHLRPVGQPPLAACVENWQRAIIVYRPSANWAQGGPIIERELETVINKGADGIWCLGLGWYKCQLKKHGHVTEGRTMLEAAMRCYVGSKFGDEVNDELG